MPDHVSTIAPIKRGLKDRTITNTAINCQVSTIAPIKRGLKGSASEPLNEYGWCFNHCPD